MATTETELLDRIELLARSRYLTALADPSAVTPSHKDLVKYGTFLMSVANKFKGTTDRNNYSPSQLEILNITHNFLSEDSQRQRQLGFEIGQLFYEINDFFEPTNLSTGANLSRTRFLDLLCNNALTDISKEQDFEIVRSDNARLIQEIRREMHFIFHKCARENHRKLDPRFIGTIGSVNSFMRAIGITFFVYEQNNPKVPIMLIFYIFAVLVWGNTISMLISSIPTSRKHHASSMFTTTSVGALIFSAFVILQENNLSRRIAIEFSFYFGLPIAHFIILHIPPVYKLIEKLYPEKNYYLPRRYPPGRNIGRNLCGSGRVLAAYHVSAYVIMFAGIINYCGYNIYKNNWAFFLLQLGLVITTQAAYFSVYYFSIPKYAKEAEKNLLLPKIRFFTLVSILRNQSLKDLQAELIWMIVFTNLFLRAFANCDLATTSTLGRMLVGIFGCLISVTLGPVIGTLIKGKVFAHFIAPASVSKNYLQSLNANSQILGFATSTNNMITRLLHSGRKYPQSLAERVQQASLAAQTGKMNIGYGDFNMLFALVMMQSLIMINYYTIEILLFNALKETNCKRGSLIYVFIEFAVNIILIAIVMTGLALILKRAKMPLILVEVYGLPTRVGRAVKELYTTGGDLQAAWKALKKNTFIKDPPAYHKDLSKRMRKLIDGNYGPVLAAQSAGIIAPPSITVVQLPEGAPFVEITPTISPL